MEEKEIIAKARQGDEKSINILLDKYKGLVNFISRKYFLVNAEYSDIVQEGMIGLFNAYMNYNLGSTTSFKTFATVCIKRQIQTALMASNRFKNIPLNTYISISSQGKVILKNTDENEDDEDDDVGFYLEDETLNPEESVLFRERLKELLESINKKLSTYEKRVLRLFMQGESYQDIAVKLGESPKSIDNALSRIKNKLKSEKGNNT